MDGRSVVGFIVVFYIAIFVIARCDIAGAAIRTPRIEAASCDA